MKMSIILYECKKAFTSPILISLILLFAAFNIFTIISSSDHKEELKIVNDIVDTYGLKITDESLARYELDLQDDLVELNIITATHRTKEYESVLQFLDELKVEDHNLYSEKEWDTFGQLQLKEMYFTMAKSIDEEYATIDIQKIAEYEIKRFGLTGPAAESVKSEYENFSIRFEEMKQNGEHKEWFFAGKAHRMHSLLFKSTFRQLAMESMILIVLATALITNFEFENRTQFITYATARGRRLMKDKLIASLLATTAIVGILMMITLSMFFWIFDYSHVWKSSINSAFTWEYNFPNVTWWDMSFSTFLICISLLVYICMILFSVTTFAISVFTKNSYVTFIFFATFFIIAYMMPSFIPTSSRVMLAVGYNLSSIVLNPHVAFMGTSGLMMFKNYEWMTVGVWTGLALVACFISLRLFTKEEIK